MRVDEIPAERFHGGAGQGIAKGQVRLDPHLLQLLNENTRREIVAGTERAGGCF